MVARPTKINLDQFETKTLLKLEARSAATYFGKMSIRGNSLLSSVYVKSIDPGATLKVNYFDTTTGSEDTGERFDLASHDLIDDTGAGTTFRQLVTRMHNKPQVEAIVTGGNVEFGVYISVIDTLTSDIDLALISDGDTFVQSTSKAIPIACLNEATGELEFIRCPLPVVSTEEGDSFDLFAQKATDPGVEVTIFSFTVPASTEYVLKQVGVSSCVDGRFEFDIDGVVVASGLTVPGKTTALRKFLSKKSMSSGEVGTLKFKAGSYTTIDTVDGFFEALNVAL